MITKEYVMAVLCTPLSFKEILNTEKSNNVVILRRLEFDNRVNYFAGDGFTANLASSPLKLMFVFGAEDAIIVNGKEDRQEVQRRLTRYLPGVIV